MKALKYLHNPSMQWCMEMEVGAVSFNEHFILYSSLLKAKVLLKCKKNADMQCDTQLWFWKPCTIKQISVQ